MESQTVGDLLSEDSEGFMLPIGHENKAIKQTMTQYFRLLHWLRCRVAAARGVRLGAHVAIAPGVDFNLGGHFKWSLRPKTHAGTIELGPETWIERGGVRWDKPRVRRSPAKKSKIPLLLW